MSDQFRYLFSPLQIGNVTVKNRIYFGPHGTMFADQDHILDERYIEYLRARAKGGAGLIIAGMMNVMFNCRHLMGIQEIYDERCVPMLKRMGEAVHEAGAKIFVQIAHKGRETDIELTRLPSWSASPNHSSTFRNIPKEMEVEDIKTVVNAFGRAAGFAKEAGLDGVEIHGASGYLMAQFMSPFTNKRTDEYGGSLENRLRFPLEVIDAIREATGDDFVLGMRITGDDLLPGGNTAGDMQEIAQHLESTGKIDFLHIGGAFYEAIFAIGCGMQVPLGLYSPYAAAFKEAVDLPVFNDFRINDPVQAEKILADGQGDMVGMIRGLIADPELPTKAREGRLEEIRYCIACDQGCFGRVFGKSKPMACTQNAVVGFEKEIGTLPPAQPKKKVLVIGGGPAGMETARVARLRGHEVVLYEKEAELGGQVNIAVKAPLRSEFGGITRYLTKQMEILGVRVMLGVEVTPEIVAGEGADAVVVATGSLPTKLPVPGADQENVVSVMDVLQERVPIGRKVVVVDGGEGHWQCCSVAEYLAEQGKEVELITSMLFVGAELATTGDLVPFYMRAEKLGIVLSPNTALKSISGTTVSAWRVYAQKERLIEGVDTVVMATFNRANNALYRSLKGRVKELHATGDCVAPRRAIDAIYDGYNLGRTI